jgi:transposase
MSAATIAELLDRDQRTVRACLKTYRDGGLQAIYQYEKHKKECQLDTHSAWTIIFIMTLMRFVRR